jgi:hypothetical protein
MSSTGPKSLFAIGFLAVCDYGDAGLCGGFLVLNSAGRPLEFHCTAPVKANRAQEILYGPTLRPFLFGEQIGRTLVERSKLSPQLVVTDAEPVLAARPLLSMPVICLASAEEPHQRPGFSLGEQFVLIDAAHPHDREATRAAWEQFEGLDLQEPFGRIREALDESRKAA